MDCSRENIKKEKKGPYINSKENKAGVGKEYHIFDPIDAGFSLNYISKMYCIFQSSFYRCN